MSELLAETILSLGEAARQFPGSRGAKRVCPSTVWRWCSKGTRRQDGQIVRLEHFRLGGRVMTTREAVARFVTALTDTPHTAPSVRTPAARAAASRRAEEELKANGC
jgi:Tfp pilus assembly protein FimT